ncbi:MAG TPA: DinB family protein [Gemmatimonadaceae bacterium]|nr:DinB family protein [Gemmatimonadaceae bacterium]
MSRRSEALADRIEEGANGLASFVEGLSEAEWNTPVPGSGRDSRPVCVAVHHVASVYPIEIDLARGIAAGNEVGVTWENVAELNAGHAKDNAGCSKADAIALLKANAKAAADAVRTFTDEQLDTAAPFGLSFGAPVTAQFVLEDHAVRHSWHHLARIKSALGR